MVSLNQLFNRTYPLEVTRFAGITSTISPASSADFEISVPLAFLLFAIESSSDATVRLYSSSIDRLSDSNFQEFILTGGVILSLSHDAIAFVNQENLIFIRITNNSGTSEAIAIYLSGLPWVVGISEAVNISAGAILIPNNQSLFEAVDNTLLSAYIPEIGTTTWNDIKVLDTANSPNNQIINNQLQIGEINTGAVIDFEISDTVLRLDWAVEVGVKLGIVLRYQSDGNMLVLEFDPDTNTIALNSVIASTITLVDSVSYPLNSEPKKKVEVRIIGIAIAVLIEGGLLKEFYTALYKDNTSFGVARIG